jgi:hypothetical protein
MSNIKKNVFECIPCKYKTCNHYDYTKHCNTIKHYNNNFSLYNENILDKDNREKNNNHKEKNIIPVFCDICNKKYKDNSGLWRHKKVCKLTEIDTNYSNQLTPEFIINMFEQNKELTNVIVEQNKALIEMSKNTHCNNIQYNNNQTFNLQLFLNETCKDAMNISDFLDSLKLQLSDLENVGKVGFVEGISTIIVKNLQALDIHKRPVHCADKKREVIYIKDENKWQKEDEDKNRMRKIIKKVAFKNQKLLSKYKEEHPGCNYSESKYSDQYSKIVIEAMGGCGDKNETEQENKIIQNITKEILIDKNITFPLEMRLKNNNIIK